MMKRVACCEAGMETFHFMRFLRFDFNFSPASFPLVLLPSCLLVLLPSCPLAIFSTKNTKTA